MTMGIYYSDVRIGRISLDYKQDEFYRMTSGSSQKMPFYMTYPMQNIFLEEAEYERDMDRLKGLYPQEVRGIQDFVDEECDKMEYEGSMMFDEYPDRLMLKNIVDRIYQKTAQPIDFEAEQYEAVESEELRMVGSGRPPFGPKPPFGPPTGPGRPPFGPPPGPPRPPRPDTGLRNLIEVMLYNEMYNRRCRHRRCKRWW